MCERPVAPVAVAIQVSDPFNRTGFPPVASSKKNDGVDAVSTAKTYSPKYPAQARPAFLSGLERSAAARYREWADAAPEHSAVLLDCAARVLDLGRVDGSADDVTARQITDLCESIGEAGNLLQRLQRKELAQ